MFDLRKNIIQKGLDFRVEWMGENLALEQRQKLAIARALLKQPDLLILDQATSSLDFADHRRIMDCLLDHSMKMGIVWVLRDPAEANRFDRVFELEDGQVIVHDDESSLLQKQFNLPQRDYECSDRHTPI